MNDDDETREAVMAAAARVQQRIGRGEAAPSIEIPRQKDGFPKVLCLDMNQWIYLSRVHYGKTQDAELVRALEAIRAGVASGRLVVPVMQANVLEASEAARNDRGRRQRLATFMIDVSRNSCIVHPRQMLQMELERAVLKHFLGREAEVFPRDKLVRWGVHDAVRMSATALSGHDVLRELGPDAAEGIPAEVAAILPALLDQVHLEPELSVLAIVDALDAETIEEGRHTDQRAAAALERARGSDDRATRLRVLMGEDAGELRSVLLHRGVEPPEFSRWLDGHLEAFIEDVPSVDVATRLIMARDRNRDARADRNDMKDMFFLEQAVPYANVVVTENSWSALAASEGLDARFSTRVLPNLRTIPELLRDERVL